MSYFALSLSTLLNHHISSFIFICYSFSYFCLFSFLLNKLNVGVGTLCACQEFNFFNIIVHYMAFVNNNNNNYTEHLFCYSVCDVFYVSLKGRKLLDQWNVKTFGWSVFYSILTANPNDLARNSVFFCVCSADAR